MSRVYFIRVGDADGMEARKKKLSRLLEASEILKVISKDDKTAIKMHFGEEGNTGFVRPEYVRIVSDMIHRAGAHAVLTDTNTLYRGRRVTAKEHRKLAQEHGFTPEIAGLDVVIADGEAGEDLRLVRIDGKFVKEAMIGSLFMQVDSIVGIAHFKGHIMTGFGGALKNIGMGCAARKGKLVQHSDISPYVRPENCVACGECVKVCPVQAIKITDKKSHIDPAKCIGCASCIASCLYNAIDIRWESGSGVIQERMSEYAWAALKDKRDKSAFINFATKITKECDCLAKDDPKISPDVGIFASLDPVGIDKASMDMVNKACGRDIFKEVHPERDGLKQLRHAASLGLGNLEYKLIEING